MTNAYPTTQTFVVTSTGAAMNFQLEFMPSTVLIQDITSAQTVPAAAPLFLSASWNATLGIDKALKVTTLGGGTNPATLISTPVTAGGVSVAKPTDVTLLPGMSFTAITAANPAVVTVASTAGMPTSGYVYIQNATAMTQINAQVFWYTVASATTITLPYLNTTGMTASTGGAFQYWSSSQSFQGVRYPTTGITAITTGKTTTVKLSTPVKFVQGQFVYLIIPPIYGAQIAAFFAPKAYSSVYNTYAGFEILSVNTSANTFTLDADTSFLSSGFSYPTSAQIAASATSIVPQAMLVGEDPAFQTAYICQAASGMMVLTLGANVVGTSGDTLKITLTSEQLIDAIILT